MVDVVSEADEPVEEPAPPGEWRRADHRDPPAVGDEITVVMYPADTKASVVYYPRMRVEIVFGEGRSVLGPTLPAGERIIEFPARPDDIVGRRAFFWRPYEERRDV